MLCVVCVWDVCVCSVCANTVTVCDSYSDQVDFIEGVWDEVKTSIIHCLELAKVRNADAWSVVVSTQYICCTLCVLILYTIFCTFADSANFRQGTHGGKRKRYNPEHDAAKKRREAQRQSELEAIRKGKSAAAPEPQRSPGKSGKRQAEGSGRTGGRKKQRAAYTKPYQPPTIDEVCW